MMEEVMVSNGGILWMSISLEFVINSLDADHIVVGGDSFIISNFGARDNIFR